MPSWRQLWPAVAVSVAILASPAPTLGVDPSPTQRLLTAIGHKLDHLRADIVQSPLTVAERRRLETRLSDAHSDLAAVGEPRDSNESAQAHALRKRLADLVRLLRERPV